MTELHRADVDLSGLLRVVRDNLYSTPDVALRELVQNAHDSGMRRALETDDEIAPRITVTANPKANTLTIADRGAGLTHDEVRQYLATIGAGYTRVLRERTENSGLIGAFGMGFLSAYVVSNRVTVVTTSYQSPDETWRFASRDGQRYSLEQTAPADIGTTVTLHLAPEFDRLAQPAVVRRLLERYCALLPTEVCCPTPVNAEPPPWRHSQGNPAQERAYAMDFAKRFEPLFEPLCTMTLSSGIPHGARGLAWIQDAGTWGTSDHRQVTLFVRGMLITDDARELLPSWAGFLGLVIECDELTPTASREDVKHDAVFDAVRRGIGGALINALSDLARTRRDDWRRVLRRHDETLLGAALADPTLFNLLEDDLRVPTSVGRLTMSDVAKRSRGPLVASSGLGEGYAEILYQAMGSPVVDGSRYGALPFARRWAERQRRPLVELGTKDGDHALFRRAEDLAPEQRDRLQGWFGDTQTAVVPAYFSPDVLPAVRVPDRDVELKQRLEDDQQDKRIASGLLALARIYTDTIERRPPARLYVNLDNPSVQALLAVDANHEDAPGVARALRSLADLLCRDMTEGAIDVVDALNHLQSQLTRRLHRSP